MKNTVFATIATLALLLTGFSASAVTVDSTKGARLNTCSASVCAGCYKNKCGSMMKSCGTKTNCVPKGCAKKAKSCDMPKKDCGASKSCKH